MKSQGHWSFLLPIWLLAACSPVLACNPASYPEAAVNPTAAPVIANRVAHFPQHLEKIETNTRFTRYGVLVLRDDGCLRLSNDPAASGGNLLVWPAGYYFDADEGTVRVSDHTGRVVAHVGDHIRVSTIRNIWEPLPDPKVLLVNGHRVIATVSEEKRREILDQRKPLRPEKHPWLPSECTGFSHAIVIGDEVSAFIPDEEPNVVPVPGSTIFFPRHASTWYALESQLLGLAGLLVLEGDCLRIGPGGKLLVWPPGFTPHIENGKVSVRNGGGKTVARVEEVVRVVGTSGPDYPGKCGGVGSYQIHELKSNATSD